MNVEVLGLQLRRIIKKKERAKVLANCAQKNLTFIVFSSKIVGSLPPLMLYAYGTRRRQRVRDFCS
jgi:hypothetical protein